jgi:hypothetical protein
VQGLSKKVVVFFWVVVVVVVGVSSSGVTAAVETEAAVAVKEGFWVRRRARV